MGKMRILTGIYKGKEIAMPAGMRPTQNKERKAIFDILGDIGGLSFLELFAGSGAVGLEAASRGVKELVLVEHNRNCLAAVRRNIAALKPQLKPQDCSVYPFEAERAIVMLHSRKRVFDIIFMDPPYYRDAAKKTLQIMGAYDIVARNGLVVVQHFKKDTLPDALGDLHLLRQFHYGDTVLSVYRKKEQAKDVSKGDLPRQL
ncbi:MAG: 16S rRNA (guanine(966)-N(2))-methyltransferase RsmD [Candidatus Omnitrophica bacterium]|nr:16S rRNA (guanine(966)-N(2))-methyltransferase RsmD [Candidatus Omnitrophota bacterium]